MHSFALFFFNVSQLLKKITTVRLLFNYIKLCSLRCGDCRNVGCSRIRSTVLFLKIKLSVKFLFHYQHPTGKDL